MIKNNGTEYIVPSIGIGNISNIQNMVQKSDLMAFDNIDFYPYTRFNAENPSFLKEYPIDLAIKKAFELGPEGIIKELGDGKL